MPEKLKGRAKKEAYLEKMVTLLNNYTTIFVVSCDNVGSNHMQKIRQSIRGKATLLMGKNTMMRKAITMNLDTNPHWESILPLIRNNVGLVFAEPEYSLSEIEQLILSQRVPAEAKVGAVSPVNVNVPKGITTLDPGKTAFVQALGISSKITRSCVEILQDTLLIEEGNRVNKSQSDFLKLLGIKPFSYGLIITSVWDNGNIIDPEILKITDAVILSKFSVGLGNVAALSLALGIPTIAAFPHAVLGAYQNLLAVVLETDYIFEQAVEFKNRVENPDAFAAPSAGATEEAVKEKTPTPTPSESSSEGGGFGMFGDESDSW